MSFPRIIRLEDLPAAQLEAALKAARQSTSLESLVAVDHFLEKIGGLENAKLAVHMLKELEEEWAA